MFKRGLFHRDTRGASIIEFALLLPLLLMILFGITELGRAIMTSNVITTAAREGARVAAVSAVSDSLSVQGRVQEVLQAANVSAKQITVQFSLENKSVKVTVTADFNVLSGSILDPLVGTIELSGETVMRYEG